MPKSPTDVLNEAHKDFAELSDYIEFCESAITGTTQVERLTQLMKRVTATISVLPVNALTESEVVLLSNTATRAEREIADRFPFLYRLGIIWLWAVFEASLDDLAVAFMLEEQRWIKDDRLRKIKVPFLTFATGSDVEQGAVVLEAIQKEISAPLKTGISRFEEVFNLIGLGGAIHTDIERLVNEFAATRNLLVHRRGIVDRSFTVRCPWAKATIGSHVTDLKLRYTAFYQAVGWYNLELIRRVSLLDQGGETPAADAQELQQVFLTNAKRAYAQVGA